MLSNEDIEWICKAAEWWHDKAISVTFKEGTMSSHHLLVLFIELYLASKVWLVQKTVEHIRYIDI